MPKSKVWFKLIVFISKMAFALIQENQLAPNIRTFGVLALRVMSCDELTQFLNDLQVCVLLCVFLLLHEFVLYHFFSFSKAFDFKLNIFIVSSLFFNGLHVRNPRFIKQLFDSIVVNEVPIDQRFLQRIDENLKETKSKILSLVFFYFYLFAKKF